VTSWLLSVTEPDQVVVVIAPVTPSAVPMRTVPPARGLTMKLLAIVPVAVLVER
jgi:hypothetical protein